MSIPTLPAKNAVRMGHPELVGMRSIPMFLNLRFDNLGLVWEKRVG